ncbi:3'(2'),5'-bisphosphate nucleotidase CysQ [uncultured Roseibium sp.]|uniref:3'(2'),5'-bisphosphate nucleotidase CysQ n=1 Tax=uncultured Roseibium sp. TaxID=1936171 RepID=UPI0032168F1B
MTHTNPKPVETTVQPLLALAIAAGAKILEIYAEPFEAVEKSDGSPVTAADAAAEAVILAGLERLFPGVPVVAEEAVEAGSLPYVSGRYFLVDPLDGTREFLKRNGEFTVNIALIESGVPVFGVVLAPALDEIYWGGALPADLAGGETAVSDAFSGKVSGDRITDVAPIMVRSRPAGGLSVLASRSHLSEETAALIDRLDVVERLSVGSSLKLCWVAAGKADLYPRLSPTMQWDIAAGDAVLRAAGGHVLEADSLKPLAYTVPAGAQKSDLLNPHFIALSDPDLLAALA